MTTENKDLAVQGNTAVVAANAGANYITMVLNDLKQSFQEANDGLDMDFVRVGDWLVLDKKGRFIEKDDPNVCYGDSIDVVIGQGEKRYSLWGLEGSPEEGMLIVAEKELADAEAALADWLAQNPQAAERYSLQDIELRYMAYVVPVETLGKDDFPKVYLMSFSPTATIEYGRWAMGIFQGKGKAAGIPARTGINKIVTRLSTEDKKSRSNASQSWLGLTFLAVGMFNPADFGITTDEAPAQE